MKSNLLERIRELAGLPDRKRIFVLVGPPSVGKSTWIKNTFEEKPYVINRDDIAEKVASEYGYTYDDMFVGPPEGAKLGDVDEKYGKVVESPEFMTWQPLSFDKVLEANNKVHELFMQRTADAVPAGKDIVIDMTNMNADSRVRALSTIEGAEEEYQKIAVIFEFEGAEDIIMKVAEKRAEAARRMGKHKTIPEAAFRRMFEAFEKPTPKEGFDKIISVDNRAMLRRLANE